MSEPAEKSRHGVSLQAALLALVALALLAGIVPAGVFLDRWVAAEVETRVRRDVELAPLTLAERNRALGDAFMMHAKSVAETPELVQAIARGDPEEALRLAENAARAMQRSALLVDQEGTTWQGPEPSADLVDATRRGELPVAVVSDSSGLYLVGLAPVQREGSWIAAVGVAAPLDEAAAGALAALARADLVLVFGGPGRPTVLSSALPDAERIRREIEARPPASTVEELRIDQRRYLYATAPFAGSTVAFVRDLTRELGILPQLRRVLAGTGASALVIALLLASLLALVLLRPVRTLSVAAERLSAGSFDAPLPRTAVRELERVSDTFGAMRSSLAGRLRELGEANRLLEERQARLSALQSELVRRERVAVTARMVGELAHEIRNPVASLRNCLELLYRRLGDDPQGREYASLAIDELLRMHELAERMLDLNRPRGTDLASCDVAEVARDVAALATLGRSSRDRSVNVSASGETRAAIAPDTLKQVLLNLVQNASEAVPEGLVLDLEVRGDGRATVIDVSDNGPGIPRELRREIFDPFFTTRGAAGGVGLGLFVVEGIVRAHGGSVSVDQGPLGGARFRVSVPAENARPAEVPAPVAEPSS